jgi:hypothetical protein
MSPLILSSFLPLKIMSPLVRSSFFSLKITSILIIFLLSQNNECADSFLFVISQNSESFDSIFLLGSHQDSLIRFSQEVRMRFHVCPGLEGRSCWSAPRHDITDRTLFRFFSLTVVISAVEWWWGSPDSWDDIAKGCGLSGRVSIPEKERNLLCSTACRPTVKPTAFSLHYLHSTACRQTVKPTAFYLHYLHSTACRPTVKPTAFYPVVTGCSFPDMISQRTKVNQIYAVPNLFRSTKRRVLRIVSGPHELLYTYSKL